MNIIACVIWSDEGKCMDSTAIRGKQKLNSCSLSWEMQKHHSFEHTQNKFLDFFLCHFPLDKAVTELIKRIALEFLFSLLVVIHCYSRIDHPQSPGHRRSMVDIFKRKTLLRATCHKIKEICIHLIKCNFHTILSTASGSYYVYISH